MAKYLFLLIFSLLFLTGYAEEKYCLVDNVFYILNENSREAHFYGFQNPQKIPEVVKIPETVTDKGVVYTVTVILGIPSYKIKELWIPSTVKKIGRIARIPYLKVVLSCNAPVSIFKLPI